jgi:hypothetical protein
MAVTIQATVDEEAELCVTTLGTCGGIAYGQI